MTSVEPLLTPIRTRLEQATPGPWERRDCVEIDHEGTYELANVIAPDPVDPDVAVLGVALGVLRPDAVFIAAAPTDMGRLLGAVDGLLALANAWEARGEHDMRFSKTVPDEDIAMDLLTNGAGMVENARHIRNAITTALEGDK